MKIKVEENSVNLDELLQKLQEKFPEYEFSTRNKKMLVAKKTKTIGANIVLRKKNVIVVGNFPTVGGSIIYSLSVVLLGFLIPVLVYFIAFNPKMKAVEKAIGAYIQSEYSVVK